MKRESLEKLEFYKVIDEIAGYSHSEATRDSIRRIAPSRDIKSILNRYGQIRELKRLRDEGFPLNIHDFHDISGILERVRPEGVALEPDELLLLLPVLRLIEDLSEVINREGLLYLRDLARGISGFPMIRARIERTVDDEGRVLDSASPALSDLRIKRRSLEKKIRKRLEEIMVDRSIAPFLQDNFISMRSGRWVIPVRMDAKGEVKGIVHDVSRSGDTAFIEPVEITGLSNELENTIAVERAEELRILRSISDLIRSEAAEIKKQFDILVSIDLLNSIVLFSERIKANIPVINESGFLSLYGARHPLLILSRDVTDVVPLSVEVEQSRRVVVISGPNAGGKTVAVKTVGLLTAMALSGIPVPASASSSIPVFRDLYVDIGDEQSIAGNLSTFSGHIRHITDILLKAGGEDLVILDELGTGTDPSQGAALGCAILEELRERNCLVFATTHLIDIVGYVYSTKGMINASMEFDHITLSPLYRLRIGEPGESHALEIAERLGLPGGIIARARMRLGKSADIYNLIKKLNDKRDNYERLIKEGEAMMQRLKEQEERLRDMQRELERQKKDMLRKAYEEAREIVSNIKRKVSRLIEERRFKDLTEIDKKVEKRLRLLSDEPLMDINAIKVGDLVYVRSAGEDLKVTKVLKEKGAVKVRIRNMEVMVPVGELSTPKGVSLKETGGVNLDAVELPELELNILGFRVDEGLSRLETYLNRAFLSGLREIRVIHGIGKGVLLRAVRDYLKGHRLVESFTPAGDGQGGNGVTIVKIVPRL